MKQLRKQLFFILILFGSLDALAGMTQRSDCFTSIARLGIEKYLSSESLFARDKRIPKLLKEIDSQTPDIDRYAQNFFNSNDKWPTIDQVKTHMMKRFEKMDHSLAFLIQISDPSSVRQLVGIRNQLKIARASIYNSFNPSLDSRIYKVGDRDLKFELIEFDYRFRGDLGEIESWYRTQNPVELNLLFNSSTRSTHPDLANFQDKLVELKSKISKMSRAEIKRLRQLADPSLFKGIFTYKGVRKRMLQLLHDKEIDIVAEVDGGKLAFIEVKNYFVPLNDIQGTSLSKKPLATQMEETRWVLRALGLEDQIELGLVFTGSGIHPREARKLMSQSIRVYQTH